MKIWKIIKSVFFALIVIGSLFVIFSSLNIFGFQMYVVRSGSMEPSIKTGSIVIDKNRDSYVTGDVITFKSSEAESVTHRIVNIENTDAGTTYTVKGDANNTSDPNKVTDQNVIGKVLFSVPWLGYAASFIRTLPGLIIFIIVPALILISDEITNIKAEVSRIRQKKVFKKESGLSSQSDDAEEDYAYVKPKIVSQKTVSYRGKIQ